MQTLKDLLSLYFFSSLVLSCPLKNNRMKGEKDISGNMARSASSLRAIPVMGVPHSLWAACTSAEHFCQDK